MLEQAELQTKWFAGEPERSLWGCQLIPNVIFVPYKDCEPNWFHRLMQRLAFGVIWKKRDRI